MRTALLTLAILLGLASAGQAATSAPSNLALGPYASSGSLLTWDDDPTVQQWFIYINAIQTFNPTRAYVQTSGTTRVGYQLTGIPLSQLPVVVSMKALAGGSLSAFSAGVTLTSSSPVQVTYVTNPPGVPLLVSGTVGGGGGGAVTQGTTPWTVAGGVYVSNTAGSPVYISPVASGLFGGNGSVTQGGPWTVSGSVGVSSFPAAYLGVSVVSQVDSPAYKGVSVVSGVNLGSVTITSGSVSVSNLTGVTVNTHAVTQGGPWTVSGSVGVSSFPAAFLGVSVVSQVDSPAFKGVSIVADTTTRFYGMTITASSLALPVTIVADTTTRFYGMTITAANIAVPVSVTSISAGTNYIGAVNIRNTAASPAQVSLTAGAYLTVGGVAVSNSNALPVSASIQTIAAALSTTLSASTSALNTAVTADYDVNTKTAITRRFAETTTYYYSTSGTSTITASGYNVVYSLLIRPSSTSPASVVVFDGATTRTSVSANQAYQYVWPRGMAIKNGALAVQVNGGSFDGAVTLETDR
jgi:hypothetical protein